MAQEDDRIRINGRVPKELYEYITQNSDNLTQAITAGLTLLRAEKEGTLHMNCGNLSQAEPSGLTEQIELLKGQNEFLVRQLDIKDDQISKLNDAVEKQAVHIQSLIQENSRLNVKLLPENNKTPWWKFW